MDPSAQFDTRALAELVYQRLKDEILFGVLPANTPLVQGHLAQQYGVSREPIKTALRLLESEGLVESRPRRTSVVAPVSKKVTQEIYEARSCLEPWVASKVAGFPRQLRAEIVDRLDDICERASHADGGPALAALDREFHTVLYEAVGNEVILKFVSANWRDIERIMRRTSGSSWVEVSWKEHREMADSILAGTPAEAADLAEAHVLRAFEWIELMDVSSVNGPAGSDTGSHAEVLG